MEVSPSFSGVKIALETTVVYSCNFPQAYMWFDVSGEMAASHCDAVAANMTLDQVAEAQGLAREWRSKHVQGLMARDGEPGESPSGGGKGDGPFAVGHGVTAPIPLQRPMPSYTDEAREARVQGDVLIQCIIRKDGIVGSIKVLEGLGYGLDESAISTITAKWRFQPGTLNGKPVDVLANISVSFRLFFKK